MIDNIAVGKTIAKLRQNKNMTQQQLAAALSVSHQAVSKWETGAALPDVQTLMALTRLFGITMEQLLNGEVPEDRVEPPKQASPFDESIQNLGNLVNNLVGSLFKPGEKKEMEEDDGAAEAQTGGEETSRPAEAEAEDAPVDAGEPREEAAEPTPQPEAGEAFDVQKLLQMAPFMTKPAVDELLLENRDKLTAADIARFAPFASQECLEKLIQSSGGEMNWDTLRKVAPFLKREMVDKLARAASNGGRRMRQAINQTGINTDGLDRTVQDVGQKIGAGVGFAFRKASKLGSDVVGEVSTAIGDFVDGMKERQSRAEALRRAACEKALEEERWDWLADHVSDMKDEALLRAIAEKANGLGMHDWVLEHLNGYADTGTIEAAIEADNWDWLGDHIGQFDAQQQEKIALAAAEREKWEWLSACVGQMSLENCAAEVAIAAYMADNRELTTRIARHCMNDEQREKLADAIVAAGNYDYLQLLAELLPPAYIDRMLLDAAQEGNWERVKQFIAWVDEDGIEKLMELAIAAGNFDAIDLLDEYL